VLLINLCSLSIALHGTYALLREPVHPAYLGAHPYRPAQTADSDSNKHPHGEEQTACQTTQEAHENPLASVRQEVKAATGWRGTSRRVMTIITMMVKHHARERFVDCCEKVI
jgi:hypothetical protein